MVFKKVISTLLIIFFIPACCPPCFSDSASYSYAMQLAKDNYRQGFYYEALHYFKVAKAIEPYALEPQKYIALIQKTDSSSFCEEESTTRGTAAEITRPPQAKETSSAGLDVQRKKKIAAVLGRFSKKDMPKVQVKKESKKTAKMKKEVIISAQKKYKKPKYSIALDPKNKEFLPSILELSLEDSFTVEGANIKRYLTVSPDVVSVERQDKSNLIITARRFGSTFFHVWDDDKRWTFNLKVMPALGVSEREGLWQEAEGFTFWYNSDWDSYYKGRRLGTMERKTLLFNQSGGVRGPTPYGKFDAAVSWSKSNTVEEISGYTVGLEKGHIGGFKDFNLRGFDFTKPFSDLTFPGNTLKGFLFESPAFGRSFEYAVIYGQEKRYFQSALFPGVVPREDTYVEGLRLGFFPQAKHSAYFNYARGYGKDRDNFLKEKVFSIETRHSLKPWEFYSEFASDEDTVAARLTSELRMPKINLKINLRDIEKKFVNIVSRPPNAGEIGSLFSVSWYPRQNLSLQSSLDVYRNRLLLNPGNPGAFNYDWNTFFNISLPERLGINTNVYYSNAPGLLSPHRNLTAQTTANKTIDVNFFGEHSLTSFLGYNYQSSTNPLSQTSDYRRYGLLTGLRFSLVPDVSVYANYNYSWLRELYQGLSDTPSVRETGIDFFHAFSPKVSSNLRVYYRDEEKADALHSFLSGEDSMEGNIHFTYTPQRDIQFFLDGRVRNVWAENHGTEKFIEADIRLGARLLWESFFRWSASTKIEGYVFKDSNGNGKKDDKEEGVAGVKVVCGPKKAITDPQGKLSVTVRAKKVTVSLDPSTIPQGYVPTTPISFELDTSSGLKQRVSFGISSQTGIYGIVFCDNNNDGNFDRADKPLAKVKVKLDNERTVTTDSNGVYFFSGLASGPHTVMLDVNSLPLEYVPATPIKTQLTVSEGITSTHNFPLRKK